MVDSYRNGLQHPDLTLSRITKDEKDAECLIDKLENISFNPFTSEALDHVIYPLELPPKTMWSLVYCLPNKTKIKHLSTF